jgi:DNA-binding MarR family transcriptional regulator
MLMDPVCNCFSLRQATRRVTQLYDQALAPLDLRATQYSLLRQVEGRGPIALNPLAEIMVMGRATLGHNVRPLEQRGLLKLAVGKDRRSREVSITAAGRRAVVKGDALWRQAQKVFEREIGAKESAALRAMLHRVAATPFALAQAAKPPASASSP